MAGKKNQVTLTFAGDDAQLERTVDHVGESTKRMSAGFAKFGRALEQDIGVRVDKVGGGLDLLSQFIGGPLGGALAGGAFAFDTLSTAMSIVSVANVKAAATWVVYKGAVVASTVAQWALNTAMRANPIGVVITAITLLVAVVVLIATKTTWFQTTWRVAWGAIKATAVAVWEWLRGLPGRLGSVFSGLARIVSSPFTTAFNAIATMWNRTVGKISLHVPSWVPSIGGKGFDVPDIPTFHRGGTVPGAPGQEVLARLQAGERVTPAGSPAVLELRSSGSALDDFLIELLTHAIRVRGGNVQLVLGGTSG